MILPIPFFLGVALSLPRVGFACNAPGAPWASALQNADAVVEEVPMGKTPSSYGPSYPIYRMYNPIEVTSYKWIEWV